MTDKTDIPDVSVIIPCYNAERWVGRAIESVLAQEGVTVEVIVIDDGSTDGSIEVLQSYGERIRFRSGANEGACVARNRGLALARADYVMFLDADDFVSSDLLASMRHSAISQSADCSVAQVFDQSPNGPRTPRRMPRINNWRYLLEDWLKGAAIAPCGLLWRKAFVLDLGGWNADLSKNQDGDLIYRAALQGAVFCRAPAGYAVYWQHHGNRISTNLSKKQVLDGLQSLANLADALSARGEFRDNLYRAVSIATHGLEKSASTLEDVSVGWDIASYRRSHGFPRYEGTRLNILACRIMGIRRKQKLSDLLHRMREKL